MSAPRGPARPRRGAGDGLVPDVRTGPAPDDEVAGRAAALGWRAGVAAGTWQDTIVDLAAALRCLRWSDDGDPRWEQDFGYSGPAPLSGQDPDATTAASLADELGLGVDAGAELLDAACSHYALGFTFGYADHVCGAALCVVAVSVYERLVIDAPISRRERDIAAAYVTADQEQVRHERAAPDQLARRLAVLLPLAHVG